MGNVLAPSTCVILNENCLVSFVNMSVSASYLISFNFCLSLMKMTKNKFFIRVFWREVGDLAPTYPRVRWGTRSYVVLGRNVCWHVGFSEWCLGRIWAVKCFLLLAHGRLNGSRLDHVRAVKCWVLLTHRRLKLYFYIASEWIKQCSFIKKV